MNCLLFIKKPSREENLTENLCDLPFLSGTSHSEAPSSSSMASDTGAPLAVPHCKQRSRHFEAIEPLLLRGLEKGKPQSESLFLSGNLRSHEGATVRKTRIITELSMPVQDAFDALLIMNLRRLPSWVVLRGL